MHRLALINVRQAHAYLVACSGAIERVGGEVDPLLLIEEFEGDGVVAESV